MKLTPVLFTTLTTACIATAALTGCSASAHGSTHTSTTSPAAGQQPPASTRSTALPKITPADISAWPHTIVPQDKAPRAIKTTAITSGYTGTSYLHKVAAKWHITLSTKAKSQVPGNPADWFTQGTVHPSQNTALNLNAAWNLKGDLIILQCTVSVKAAQTAAFLRDCTGADYPGAQPRSTAAWLDSMTGKVDSAHKTLNETVVSPLHRSGPAATLLTEGSTEQYGGAFYYVKTFGTGT